MDCLEDQLSFVNYLEFWSIKKRTVKQSVWI